VKQLIDLGLTSDSTILDIGCGTGILINYLENYLSSPKNYMGMDMFQTVIDYCKENYPTFDFIKGDVTKSIPIPDRKFDMICLWSVFTHIYPTDIIKSLKIMKDHLNPNGIIVAPIFSNSMLSSWTGTLKKIEMNPDYFSELVKKAGFTKVIPCKGKKRDNTQYPFKIGV